MRLPTSIPPVLALLLALCSLLILPAAAAHRVPATPDDLGTESFRDICPDLDRSLDDWQSASRLRKVAIIGAGPSGTSASYFLKTAQDRLNALPSNGTADRIQITIFERDTRVGGRTAVTFPYNDQRYEPVEMGASIYAGVNYNVRRAVRNFGLQTGAQNGVDGEIGVWDGQQFLFRGDSSSWWTSARFFLRYGNSPLAVQKLVKKMLSTFLRLYSPKYLHYPDSGANTTVSGFPWKTISDLATAVNILSPATVPASDYFAENGISTLFVEEMVEAATRVNYAQDTTGLHGFGALVSLAASDTDAVLDGNYRVFEEFAKRSGARLKLGQEGTVTGLVKFDSLRDAVKSGKITCREAREYGWNRKEAEQARWWVGTRDGEGDLFDAVIVAAPWHDADITLLNTDKRIAKPPYVHLYVTLLTTTAKSANPEYFGFGKGDSLPTTILTSGATVRRALQDRQGPAATGGGDAMVFQDQAVRVQPTMDQQENTTAKSRVPEFLSLNYLRPLRTRSGQETTSSEHVVKIFSLAPISDEQLHRLFAPDTIGWTHRKQWFSYPFLRPTHTFPRVVVDENLYFPNAFETLASTMETSVVSSRNAVALLLRKWYGEEFVNGGEECGFQSDGEGGARSEEQLEDEILQNPEWAGWGCRSG